MRIVKLVTLFLGIVAIGLIVTGLLLPSSVHVERQILIHAEPDRIFPLLNDLRAFNRWSPWAQKDPLTHFNFSGPDRGVGAQMSWYSAQPQVGAGSQEIIASVANQRVAVALSFGDKSTAVGYYDLQRIDGQTEVTWGFDSEFGYDLFSRYFGLMAERWIGPDYEQGLNNLKTLVETTATETPLSP
jgi:hypothetical protein